MQDFGTKADNTAGPSGELSAAEFNNLAGENENAVLRSGQALTGASETQLAQSLFIHSVKSDGFQDSGAANAYVATPISGASGVSLPSSYATLNGATVTFVASATNTGASTLNIGQTTGTLLGTKAIRTQSDTAIPAGAIVAGRHVQVKFNSAFDSGAGAWVLLPWAVADNGAHGIAVFNASGTWNVPAGVTQAEVEVIGAGGGGGRFDNGGGGGGGGGVAKAVVSLIGVSSVAVTVGTGGAGRTGSSGAGTVGGTSQFGSFATATGGTGGSLWAGGATGSGSVGNVLSGLGNGHHATRHDNSATTSKYGGGNGGGPGGAGSTSGTTGSAGNSAVLPGGGGGGGNENGNGGNGANGQVIVRW